MHIFCCLPNTHIYFETMYRGTDELKALSAQLRSMSNSQLFRSGMVVYNQTEIGFPKHAQNRTLSHSNTHAYNHSLTSQYIW